MSLGDVKENADAREADNEARPAVGDERERNSGQRREAHHRREVDRRLRADEHRQPGGEPLAEGVAAGDGDPQPCVGEGRVRRHHREGAEQAELLADD
ncbi:MAG TPA: hypothetical protein VLN26_08365, partial [Gaiellaceae bacterium]|nr:hypothetical protein [Gaiellaceae bacterium]